MKCNHSINVVKSLRRESMKMLSKSIGTMVLAICFALAGVDGALAATEWVELDIGGTKVRSILALPEGPGPHPAVIFNHGTGVRHHGYEGSKSKGQSDVKDFTDALVKDGYVALAPIRPFLADDAYRERGRNVGSGDEWTMVVEKGIETVQAAKAYLTGRDDVAKDKIAVVGFSEGGNVTLWTATRTPGFKAVVLMSPASIGKTKQFSLRNAARKGNVAKIKAPVLLTLGEDDLRSIKKVVTRRLIPNLEDTNDGFESRTDYPGDHSWFHRVQEEHWSDVAAFLAKHLT